MRRGPSICIASRTGPQNQDPDWDLGYFRLKRPIGALTGWYGFGYNTDNSFFTGNFFSGFGYPLGSGYDSGALYQWGGQFDSVTDGRLVHNRQGDSGMIGSSAHTGGRVWCLCTFQEWFASTYTRLVKYMYDFMVSNMAAALPPSSQLIPLDVSLAPKVVTAGDQLSQVGHTLHNEGGSTYDGPVSIKYYLSTDTTINCQTDTLFYTGSSTVDLPSRDSIRFIDYNITVPQDVSGDYWVGVCINGTVRTKFADDLEKITIEPLPLKLVATPSSLAFSATVGGDIPANKTIAITHQVDTRAKDDTEATCLSWTATKNKPWLQISPTSGSTCSPGTTMTVSVNPAQSSPPGDNGGIITITASGDSNSSLQIPVTLSLSHPSLVDLPDNLVFEAQGNSVDPPFEEFDVVYSGGASPSWSATTNTAWLKAERKGDMVQVVVDPAGLSSQAAPYKGEVRIKATGVPDDGVVPVELYVVTSPHTGGLRVKPDAGRHSGRAGYAGPVRGAKQRWRHAGLDNCHRPGLAVRRSGDGRNDPRQTGTN